MLRILVLHGPNLNLLGTREQSVYGTQSLDSIDSAMATLAEELALQIDIRQSNSEGELVNWIQESGSAPGGSPYGGRSPWACPPSKSICRTSTSVNHFGIIPMWREWH